MLSQATLLQRYFRGNCWFVWKSQVLTDVTNYQIDVCSYDRCRKTWLDTSWNWGTSKKTPPLYRHRGKMDVSIVLFPTNLRSITDEQKKSSLICIKSTLYCPISNWWHFYLQNKTADDICKMEKHHNNTAESKETHYNVKRRRFKNGSGTD